MNLCMVPNCGRGAINRGLCQACYKAGQILVLQGRTTWQELQETGKCGAPRRRKSEFLQHYFLPNKIVAEIEEKDLVEALENQIKNPEASDHVHSLILDHIRDQMETHGLTTTHTIGRLIAAIEKSMIR